VKVVNKIFNIPLGINIFFLIIAQNPPFIMTSQNAFKVLIIPVYRYIAIHCAFKHHEINTSLFPENCLVGFQYVFPWHGRNEFIFAR